MVTEVRVVVGSGDGRFITRQEHEHGFCGAMCWLQRHVHFV